MLLGIQAESSHSRCCPSAQLAWECFGSASELGRQYRMCTPSCFAPNPPQAICSLIYAGERVSTDLNEVAVVAKMLISKYGCAGRNCVAACMTAQQVCSRLSSFCQPTYLSASLSWMTPAPLNASVFASQMKKNPPFLPLCRSMYKSSGFPEEVVSDLTCRKWQVNDTLVECLAVTAPLPETKLQVRCMRCLRRWRHGEWSVVVGQSEQAKHNSCSAWPLVTSPRVVLRLTSCFTACSWHSAGPGGSNKH